jgi:hypothetical protein
MKERTFEVRKGYEGWTLYRMEKDEAGTWKSIPPIICASKQAAQASGREWKSAIRPVRRR